MKQHLSAAPATLALSLVTAALAEFLLSFGLQADVRTQLLGGGAGTLGMALLTGLLAEPLSRCRPEGAGRLVYLWLGVWLAAELIQLLWQAHQLCWQQFSSLAVIGLAPGLLWIGWCSGQPNLDHTARILWWFVAVGGLIALLGLGEQARWQRLMETDSLPATWTVPLYAEYFTDGLRCQSGRIWRRRTAARYELGRFFSIGCVAGADLADKRPVSYLLAELSDPRILFCAKKGGPPMLNRRTLALAALGLWCLLFVRTRTTEKSMVRAVMLEWDAQGWTAGLLYQAPEAAADSSEASAQVRFAAAQGGSLGQALSTAEGLLPQQADYRLCDHVLLAPGCTQGWLREYEQLVLERRCGRLTARILGCGFTCQELSQASEETEGLPEKLLQAAKQAVPSAGVLYQREEGLTVPLLALQQDGVHRAEGGLLLSPSGRTRLTEDQLQAALMIQKKWGERRFWANGQELCLRVAAVSLEQQKESFLLRMDCQPRAGGVEPDQEQAVQLEQLCQEVVQLYWTYGVDLAGLCPFARSQNLRAVQIQKNICPQVQADVRFLQW